MTTERRLRHNRALAYAVDHAARLGCGLVILDAVRRDYPWACPRHHAPIVRGMTRRAGALEGSNIAHMPFVERVVGQGKGLLEALCARAYGVVTDYRPGFFQRRMVEKVAVRLNVPVIAIDDTGVAPLAVAGRAPPTAFWLRRVLQKGWAVDDGFWEPVPQDPVADFDGPECELPDLSAWPMATREELSDPDALVRSLGLDGPDMLPDPGDPWARWERFRDHHLGNYLERNHPDEVNASSNLSADLHYGHLSAAAMVQDLVAGVDRASLGPPKGSRYGFWPLPDATVSFLDELVTWRELAHAWAHYEPDTYQTLDSIPAWAKTTIAEHAADPREVIYTLDELAMGKTHDPVFNAAANELREAGRMHNALRMLWGKLIYAWSPSAQVALEHMIELNNRYALDGRDANSYAGILWVMGRADRAWGPERLVFGKLRYMTTASSRRKWRLKGYLARWASEERALSLQFR